MADQRGRRWTRDEAVAALALYCQTPFGKIHTGNKAIQQLAKRLERTPSSIALRLANFASLDPAHQARGVKGMSQISALCKDVWEEFYGKWEALADADRLEDDAEYLATASEKETETTATIKVRRGQQFFRRMVLGAYGYRCCITGIAIQELLRASHIRPWARDSQSRLDPTNGLALNSLHDAAFDRGLIAFDDERRLLLSKRLYDDLDDDNHQTFFQRYEGSQAIEPERFVPMVEHLRYHREHIFQN